MRSAPLLGVIMGADTYRGGGHACGAEKRRKVVEFSMKTDVEYWLSTGVAPIYGAARL